jgi:hypothetical protein
MVLALFSMTRVNIKTAYAEIMKRFPKTMAYLAKGVDTRQQTPYTPPHEQEPVPTIIVSTQLK